MANNVAITPGSGDIVAAEEISSAKYQLVKLVDSTSTSTTRTGVAANPLQVSLANTGANATPVVVDLGANNDVTVTSGTITIVSTVTTVSTVTGGGIAHDSADSGNPIKVGAKAIAALSGATLVSAADRADNQADLDGALIVRNNFALGDLVNGNASNTDGSSTQVLAAGAAGVKHYITDVTITNTSASNIYVELKDNTTVKWTFPVPANGGVTHHFSSPLGGTAATAWNFDPSAAATTVYCSVSGFKSKI